MYDWANHPDHISQPGAYPLVVATISGTKRVHKVLMDRGSYYNPPKKIPYYHLNQQLWSLSNKKVSSYC
jgi:hypothetical protein